MDKLGNCVQVNNEKVEVEAQGSQGDETKATCTKPKNNSFKRSHTEGEETVKLSKGNLLHHLCIYLPN